MTNHDHNNKTQVTVRKITAAGHVDQHDVVVRETAITLYLNNTELVTLVCSPTNLRELCYGFLFAEGIITKTGDVTGFSTSTSDGLVWIETREPATAGNNFLKRHVASCCGRTRASFYFVNDTSISPVNSDIRISPAAINALTGEVERRSMLFAATGGAHGAALSDGNDILAFFEDVGRHNTLDKLAGWCLLQGIPARDKILFFTGRVSSEIAIKTARMGVPVIVSRSAPTDLGLELAGQLGVTVVGFARGNRMNVYTRCDRVI